VTCPLTPVPAAVVTRAKEKVQRTMANPKARRVINLVTAGLYRFGLGFSGCGAGFRRFCGVEGKKGGKQKNLPRLPVFCPGRGAQVRLRYRPARNTPHGTARRRTSEEDAAQRSTPRDGRQNGAVWRLGHAGRVCRDRVRTSGRA